MSEIQQGDDLVRLIDEGSQDELFALLEPMHPADAAELFSQVDPEHLARFIELVGPAKALSIFEFVPFEQQKEALGSLRRETLAGLISQMSPDDRADLVEDLDEHFQERLLALLMQNTRQNILQLTTYPEDSAGAYMTTAYALLRPESSIQSALEHLRLQAPNKETIYYSYVVDRARRLVGIVSLRKLIISPPHMKVGDIMAQNVISVTAEMDIEEVAKIMANYDFLAVPVVDAEARLVGIITYDDLYDVIAEEATEDMYRLANLDTNERINSSMLRSVKLRSPWLMVNLCTALVASYTVGFFSQTISQVVALASLMTIVASVGGNAGNQSLTVVVRAMALGEISLSENWKVMAKEVMVGLTNGTLVGLVCGLVTYARFGTAWLGVVMWMALIGNLLISGLFGALVPFSLRKLNLDPALGSSILLTMATDVGGFFIFLGLATLFLSHLA